MNNATQVLRLCGDGKQIDEARALLFAAQIAITFVAKVIVGTKVKVGCNVFQGTSLLSKILEYYSISTLHCQLFLSLNGEKIFGIEYN